MVILYAMRALIWVIDPLHISLSTFGHYSSVFAWSEPYPFSGFLIVTYFACSKDAGYGPLDLVLPGYLTRASDKRLL